MDFLSAAQIILEQANGPLHYKEITQRALSQGLLFDTGLTPEATMGSRLYVDVKKRDDSRFERVGKGRFQLRRKPQQDDIARRVDEINDLARKTLRRRLYELPADRFEVLIGELLIAVGFNETSVQVTSYSNDGGIDVRGVLNAGDVTTVNAAVQVKRWKRNVQSNVVRELRGSLTAHEQGIIITTSDFSAGARTEASAIGKSAISLVNGDGLIELLIKHEIGVTRQPYTVYSLDDEWWAETQSQPGRAEELSTAQPSPPTQHIPGLTFPVVTRALNKPDKLATLLSPQGVMQFDDVTYSTPSAAGKVVSGWKACNGWRYWQYQHPETKEWRFIVELRR